MRRLGLLLGLSLAAGPGLVLAGGCTTTPINTSLRALEESGRVSFICLGSPLDDRIQQPLERCRNVTAASNKDFSGGTGGSGGSDGTAGTAGAGSTSTPHLYGLVTQTFRGEVAVIDLTTTGGDTLIDQDPSVPGPNFLPVGAQPIGIVSTPGGTASFVTTAEVGREAIYAIPSELIVRRNPDQETADEAPPRLSTWPACTLPAAPGEPMLLFDPADADGLVRTSCDDQARVDPDKEPPSVYGNLDQEGHGRQKLVVPLPSLGGIAVYDAQTLLNLHDQDKTAFDPCPTPERWVLFDEPVPVISPPPYEPPPNVACVPPKTEAPEIDPALTAIPAGMAHAGDRLYVADLALPLIHRLDVTTPCAPNKLPPLVATSLADPSRIVTTNRLAVTAQPTAALQRFLYADDVGEGTVMVFDISDDAKSTTPLLRDHPEWTPLTPPDRLRFVSAPRDLIVAQRDVAQDIPNTGVAPEGTLCNPDPNVTACDASTASCDPGTLYRTASDFGSGAAPFKLRGSFAFVLLTNGQVEVVDIEDLDAPCRIPDEPFDTLLGCKTNTCTKAQPSCPTYYSCAPFAEDDPPSTEHPCELTPPTCTKDKPTCPANFTCPAFAVGAKTEHDCEFPSVRKDKPGEPCPSGFIAAPFVESDAPSTVHTCFPGWDGSDEMSCNIVQANTLRSSVFVLNSTKVGNNAPGLTQLPLAFDKNGAFLDTADDDTIPRIRASVPATGEPPLVSVGGVSGHADKYGTPGDGDANLVALNLETPRAQLINQTWSVTFEGPLPRLGIVAAELRVRTTGEPDPAAPDGLYDSSAAYCDGGVLSRAAAREQLIAAGDVPEAELDAEAQDRSDRVQIGSAFPDQDNAYWNVASSDPDPDVACTFDECRAIFGDADAPLPSRDFIITEAYQDRLLLEDSPAVNAAGEVVKPSALKAARCCFPTYLNYAVRPGDQWTVVGSQSGYLHHTIADPATGACRTSCEPYKERMNGRAIRTPRKTEGATDPVTGDPVTRLVPATDGSPEAFINQMIRFSVIDGKDTQPNFKRAISKKPDPNRPQRDTQFRFTTTGAFSPLTVTLLADTRDLAPVGITLVPPTGELAVTDGALQGLITVSLSSVSPARQFY